MGAGRKPGIQESVGAGISHRRPDPASNLWDLGRKPRPGLLPLGCLLWRFSLLAHVVGKQSCPHPSVPGRGVVN